MLKFQNEEAVLRACGVIKDAVITLTTEHAVTGTQKQIEKQCKQIMELAKVTKNIESVEVSARWR